MISIPLRFERFADASVESIFRQVGVYVLWDDECTTAPAYIGQGMLLGRLGDHARNRYRFSGSIDGYMAVLGGCEKLRNPTLLATEGEEAPIVSQMALNAESLLIQRAREIGISPRENVRRGVHKHLRSWCSAFGTVDIRISGHDPLIHPSKSESVSDCLVVSASIMAGRIKLVQQRVAIA